MIIKGLSYEDSLARKRPDLAAQWHPTKNGGLRPEDVTCGSNRKVWWLLPYDDPNTGKHFDFEWEAIIGCRFKGVGCPYLSGNAVWKGFNDLATMRPDLAKEWHPTRNGDLRPEDITCGSGMKVWWFLSYDDPKTGKHFDFEWKSSVVNRVRFSTCPYLTQNPACWLGFNDLATMRPDLAKEWHPTKNGNLTPDGIAENSGKIVWWLLSYDDPITGKHFDFEWKARVIHRVKRNDGCPYLSGKAVWKGFNDLATMRPGLAKEWHPTKNGDLKPCDVTFGSSRKAWWFLPYDDPKTGKHFDFEWEAVIANRSKGIGCPYLENKAVCKGFNDLATIRPDLAKEWHPTKNGDLRPDDVTCGSGFKVWWFLPYDDPKTGKHFDFEWEAIIGDRVHRDMGCPYLTKSRGEMFVQRYFNERGIKFESQKRYRGLSGIGNKPLSYDFYVESLNVLIEYHGIQHYKPIEYFGGKGPFDIQKEHDRRKRQYAIKYGISLIEISYKYDTYEAVAEYLDEKMLAIEHFNQENTNI